MAEPITEDQFRQLYRSHIDAIYAYVWRRCGRERELAEDITQEVWFRALRDWRRNGSPENPIGWLTVAARNLIINHMRKRATVPLELVDPRLLLAEGSTPVGTTEIDAAVSEAIARIPKGDAQLLSAFHNDHFKTSELAELHGVSPKAIEGRLRRARERLRRELENTLKRLRGIA